MDVSDLVHLYTEADSNLSALFAEQRSNLLLVAGNHYNKKDSRFWRRLREVENISKAQRLRLTKNHIQKITKTYINNILTFAPGVAIGPKNESELSDMKSAELHNAVWQDLKVRHKFNKKRRQFAQDFVEIGEAACKVFFDPNGGSFIGYEPVLDEMGAPTMRDDGLPEHQIVFTGDIVFERIHGFNLLSDPTARSAEEARWYCYRKMVPVADLEKQFEHDEEKLTFISASSDETFKVFDTSSGSYGMADDLVMVMEFYFKPCADYPNGWYAFCTKAGILFEGELPLGLFPIVYVGFDEASTSARSYSIIKQLRPYQAEVNRSASKIAEHQITLGDDKVLLMNGSSMEAGGTTHGVKAIKVTGTEPKVMSGRNGDHYAGYMASQISEMYQVANVVEDAEEKSVNNIDPYAMLFQSAKQKKRFVLYTEKFQEFEQEICELALRFSKAYFRDEMLIPMVGKKAFVNIEEFRNADELGFQIRIDPQTEDLESRLGKQLAINHLIQYAGPNMAAEDLGRLARSMEYLNKEMLFDDKTIDYDNATSDILMLDRGKWVEPNPEENHAYIIKRLVHRKKSKDFDSLPDQVRQMYDKKIEIHRQMQAQQIAAAQAAKDGFIPTGGFLVSCDFYVPDPADPMKARRLRIPAESLSWLQKRLEQQGTGQAELEQADLQTQARVAQMIQQRGPQSLMPPESQPAAGGGVY